jgi:methionine-rich copper-binding protein CopC
MKNLRRAMPPALIVAIAVAALWAPGPAHAERMHVSLTKSSPAAKEALATSPAKVQLWFSEKVELKASSLKITGPAGVVTSTPLTGQDSVAAPATATILGDMPPGAYRIDWAVASKDGHAVKGVIQFSVKGR